MKYQVASICTLMTADRIKTAMHLLNSSVQKKISKLPRYRYHLFVHSTVPQWSAEERIEIITITNINLGNDNK